MIINYTKQNDEYIAKYLAEVTGDEIYQANLKINVGDCSSIFSETPYVLVADYQMLCKARSLVTMGRTPFEGSKIFYLIIVDDKNAQKKTGAYHSFAKSICAVKNMVLFGCDAFQCLKENERESEEQIEKVKRLGTHMRDMVPLNGEHNCAYPLRCNN